MKKINNFTVILLVVCLPVLKGYTQGNQKLAQTGFQFLSVVSDARGAALAEAMTSLQTGSSSLFFNPAGMAGMENMIDISGSTNKWIADINQYTFALAFKPGKGEYGVWGLSLQSVDYGDFYGTRVSTTNPRGFEDTEIFSPSALAAGLGYAKKLTGRFAVGFQVRWVNQNLGESIIPDYSAGDTSETKASNELSPLVFDFGTQFKTGIKSLVFGMSVRNFSKEIKFVEEGFQAPLTFTLGISMNLMDLFENIPYKQKLFMSIDASHYIDHPEQVKIGADWKLMDLLSLRGGYISDNYESGFTYGVGISSHGFTVDYAYTPFGVFDNVQRLTGRFSW